MFLWITISVWIVSIGLSYINGNSKLPTTVLVLGILDLVGIFVIGVGAIGLAFLALLSVIMLISLKVDNI